MLVPLGKGRSKALIVEYDAENEVHKLQFEANRGQTGPEDGWYDLLGAAVSWELTDAPRWLAEAADIIQEQSESDASRTRAGGKVRLSP